MVPDKTANLRGYPRKPEEAGTKLHGIRHAERNLNNVGRENIDDGCTSN